MPTMTEEGRRPTEADRMREDMFRTFEEFSASDRLLLSPDRMTQYSGKWAAAFKGDVVESAMDLNTLIDQVRARNIPLGNTAIRFIEKNGMAAA